MKTLSRCLIRLRNFVTGRRGDQRLREELEDYVAREAEANIQAGMSEEEARRQARLKLGVRGGDPRAIPRRGRIALAGMSGAGHTIFAATDEAFAGVHARRGVDDGTGDCGDDNDIHGGVFDAAQELALSTVGEDCRDSRHTDCRAVGWGADDGSAIL